MQSRRSRRFQSLNGGTYVFFSRARERRNRHVANFLRHFLDRFQVSSRRDRKTCFNHVHIQGGKLPRQANLLRRVHRETRRLLAVTERGVKNAYDVHRVPQALVTHTRHPAVQFIFVLHLIISPYTGGKEFPLDLGELQVFLMVAKEGSFSRAGERLYRTQPAISLAIRKLEDSLGQPLFVRGARPVRLTDAGTLLKDYAERLINLPHEGVNYRLDLGAISYVPRDAQLLATEIRKDELTLVVPPKHLLAKKREVDVAELGNENFIAHSVESPFRRRVIELFARHRTALNMPIEMPTIESIKRFVQMGMGVAIVPRMCVQWEIEHGWMKELKVRQLNMPRHVYLVSRRGARLPHAANELMRILRAE